MSFPISGLPVLVVDDNATNRRILKEMLKSWGMLVETVEGGRQAIEALQKDAAADQSLPLVISDVHMPVMDGFMLTEKIRAITALHEPVIILLTSGGKTGDLLRCRQLGVRAHLIKPVKQSELLESIVGSRGSINSASCAHQEQRRYARRVASSEDSAGGRWQVQPDSGCRTALEMGTFRSRSRKTVRKLSRCGSPARSMSS